jgi:hypothetical protein
MPMEQCLPIGALLELVVELNHGVADLVKLVAIPGNRQRCSGAHDRGDSEPSSPYGSPLGDSAYSKCRLRPLTGGLHR